MLSCIYPHSANHTRIFFNTISFPRTKRSYFTLFIPSPIFHCLLQFHSINMLKRKESPTSAVAGASKKKGTDKSTVQSSLTMWVKPTADASTDKSPVTLDSLTSELDDNMKNLLKLEVDTMDQEWLQLLKGELRKSYFLEVQCHVSSCLWISCDLY
jgi:hypothetical protein